MTRAFAERECAHVDCDGWRTEHKHQAERLAGHGHVRRLVCDADGPVTPYCGPGVGDYELRQVAACTPTEVWCDGRCQHWPPTPGPASHGDPAMAA